MGSSFSMTAITGGGTSPEDTCVICYGDGPEEIENEEGQIEQVQQVQICPNPTPHYAHLSCITKWYNKADTCPECRVNVRDFPLWQDIKANSKYTILMNLILKKQFADARELMFNYTMDNVEINYEDLMQEIEKQMEQEQEQEQEQEEENDIYDFLNYTVYLHNIYDSLIRKGDHDEALRLRGDYEVTSNNETVITDYRNALDISLYIDYANSPAYDPEGLSNDAKLEVMEQLDAIVRALRFPEENLNKILSKNSRIIEMAQVARDNEAIQNLKAMLLDYTIQGVQDVNYWFIYEVLRDDGETDENIQDMIFMHWTYDSLIQNAVEETEDFIEGLQIPGDDHYENKENYRNALDIQPYIDYVNSDEFVVMTQEQKDYTIEKMDELRDALGFTDVQQGGRVQQYGGMWQRGGFFMTCS